MIIFIIFYENYVLYIYETQDITDQDYNLFEGEFRNKTMYHQITKRPTPKRPMIFLPSWFFELVDMHIFELNISDWKTTKCI